MSRLLRQRILGLEGSVPVPTRGARSRRELQERYENEDYSETREVDVVAGPASKRDFSRVKVHADPRAQGTPEAPKDRESTPESKTNSDLGYTVPKEIPRGDRLEHEMAPTEKAVQTGEPSRRPDDEPKEEKAGIGAMPPEESFGQMTEPGEEKGFVLFKKDDASLTGRAEKRLLELIADRTEPLLVEIHGYASVEGPDEYNLNLSAHRAVAVKRFLQDCLPPGSKVVLFAHGETRSFGAHAKNRRAGVWIGPKPVEREVTPRFDLGLRLKLGASPPPLHEEPPIPLPLHRLLPPVEASPSPYFQFGVPTPRFGDQFKLDWGALAEPGVTHDQWLTTRDVKAIEEKSLPLYKFYLRLGLGHEKAELLTNLTLQSAIEHRLILEHPNVSDQLKADILKLDPEYTELIIPVSEIIRALLKEPKQEDTK